MSKTLNNISTEKQMENVSLLYNKIASIYDDSFEGKADYQIPKILIEIYKKYEIKGGILLDIGCGTGKIKEYLGNSFTYKGIDISKEMLKVAEKRNFEVYLGSAENILEDFKDKSVDHIIALSSLYFIKDWRKLILEFERVAKKSIFVSLEQFEPKIIEIMKKQEIDIYNHSLFEIKNPTEFIKNTFLWKRPNTEDRILGDLVFKKLS